ncbi:MAG: hypothetical protein QXR73_02455, partial [Candidatus Micrarchaeaceae archaeon]
MLVLPISFCVGLLLGMVLFASIQYTPASNNNNAYSLNVTSVANVFNVVGKKYFDVYGYLVGGNMSYGKFINGAAGKVYGFKNIDIV